MIKKRLTSHGRLANRTSLVRLETRNQRRTRPGSSVFVRSAAASHPDGRCVYYCRLIKLKRTILQFLVQSDAFSVSASITPDYALENAIVSSFDWGIMIFICFRLNCQFSTGRTIREIMMENCSHFDTFLSIPITNSISLGTKVSRYKALC